ncbi:MAG: tyrosine-type recombinase/integrase [Caulobacterales bacterium]
MSLNRLTDRMVRQVIEPGWYVDGAGLRLRVRRNLRTGVVCRTWVLRLTLPGGVKREVSLGTPSEITLAEVRRKAEALRAAAAKGEPLKAAFPPPIIMPTTLTFREATGGFLSVHTKSLKNPKNTAQWGTTRKTYAWPTIGDVPVDQIDRSMVLRIVEPLWGVKTETGNRVRARIAAVLDWAAEAGLRDPNAPNPARKDQFKKSLPPQRKVQKVRHHAAIAIDDAPHFARALCVKSGIGPRAFEFCILTATRTSETLEAKWSEIDLDHAVWTIPAERMKMGVAHRVPLSGRALAILAEMRPLRRDDDYVFPGAKAGRPLSNMVFLMQLRKVGRDDITAHGFRSTFRDWCAERTEVLGEVAEAALAHAVGSKVEAAYRRGDLFDKRRDLMARWAAFLLE